MERIDKILSNLGYGTRKDLKKIVKNGLVEVNGEVIKDSGLKVDPEKDVIIMEMKASTNFLLISILSLIFINIAIISDGITNILII